MTTPSGFATVFLQRDIGTMTTNKQALLNYLQFLKDSGFVCLDADPSILEPLELKAAALATTAAHPRENSMPPRKPAASKPTSRTSPASPAPSMASPRVAPAEPEFLTAPAFDTPPLPLPEREAALAELAAKAEACRACALGHSRIQSVFNDGPADAKLMFVGEAPGQQEDESGVPFVGRAGQLLTKMVAAIGFSREEVYICNTLKCRPPDNRDPLPEEKAACEHFLVAQIGLVRPSLIVALGAHAAQYLCRSELTIGKLRGKWHNYHGVPLLATYHPSYLLRSPGMKVKSWEDFQLIHAKYTELNPGDPRKIWKKEG
jgi:DNA polymerase